MIELSVTEREFSVSMNRRIIGIFITSVLSALPALGATILDNLPESPISKFCNDGGDLHCSKATANGDETPKYSGILGCTNGPKSGISQQELDAAATEYCNLLYNDNAESNFDLASASRAAQNEIPAWQLPPAADDTVVPTEVEEVATVESTVTDTCGDEDACKQKNKQQFLNQHPNAEAAICVQGNWQIAICKNGTQPDTYKHQCTRKNTPLVYFTKCIEPIENEIGNTVDPARDRAEETCNKIKREDFLGETDGATDAECINNQWQITKCDNSLFGQNEQTATLKGQSIKYYASCEECRVTNKWKKDNHAQDAECDPKTGEIYITQCDTGYLLTEQILDSNHNTLGYKKCEPNFETSKNLCEKDGNGKWQEKRNKCDCKNNYFWDENDGCVASTENLKQATKKLEQLKSLLDEKLKTLNSAK